MASVETISNVFTATIRNMTRMLDSKVSKTFKINGHSLNSDHINLSVTDIEGIENVNNTSDMDKPVSLATEAALELRAPLTTSINGHELSESNITIISNEIPGIENVDNTSDLNKPVSTAMQTALNLKVDKTRTVNGYALSSDIILSKSDVGLAQSDNTSDLDKPISNATQSALDIINSTLQSLNSSLGVFSQLLANAVPVGVVVMIFTNTVPLNYLICDGSVLSQSDYPELYAVLGTTYCDGSVDTQVNFQLPDLRGEFVRGLDRGRNIDPNRIFGVSPQLGSTALPVTQQFGCDSQGAHVHSTLSSGDHYHTTDSQGAHTHTTSVAGAHQHNITYNTSVQSGTSTRCLSLPNYNGQVTLSTTIAGDHTHTINSSGAHTHTSNTTGAHTHTVTLAGAHSHSVVSGGDLETRPINHACNFAIKAKSA